MLHTREAFDPQGGGPELQGGVATAFVLNDVTAEADDALALADVQVGLAVTAAPKETPRTIER